MRHYERGGGEYDDARTAWATAAESDVWQSAGATWLLDVMRGNLELRVADYDLAALFYESSLAGVQGGDESLRPAVGLAEVGYLNTFEQAEDGETVCPATQRAEYVRLEGELTAIVEADRANDLAGVRKKALFTRARIGYCLGWLDGTWEAVRADSALLTEGVTTKDSTVDRRLAAYGHVLLGQVALDADGDRSEAQERARLAQELVPPSQADAQEVVYIFVFELAAKKCDESELIDAQTKLVSLDVGRSWPTACGDQPAAFTS